MQSRNISNSIRNVICFKLLSLWGRNILDRLRAKSIKQLHHVCGGELLDGHWAGAGVPRVHGWNVPVQIRQYSLHVVSIGDVSDRDWIFD